MPHRTRLLVPVLATLLLPVTPHAATPPLPPAASAPPDGTDAARLSVLGVRLYMPAAEARAALERTGLFAAPWRERDVPCAAPAAAAPAAAAPAAGTCIAEAILSGPVGATLRFVEDLPAHPGRSVVAEVQVSAEPRHPGDQAAFHRRLLSLYGPPDLHDDTGMQWGRLSGPPGARVAMRTLPLLESSHDEMLRLSDTGFEERAMLAALPPGARLAAAPAVPPPGSRPAAASALANRSGAPPAGGVQPGAS